MADQLSFAKSFCHLYACLSPPPCPSGYETVYKGKWHLVKPVAPEGVFTQQDLATYGYSRWTPPDAGADQSLPEGGGNPLGGGNHDIRCAQARGWEGRNGSLLAVPVCCRCMLHVLNGLFDAWLMPDLYLASACVPAGS
jgi:hypothetical protein